MFRDKTGGLRKTLKNLAELVYCEAPHDLKQELILNEANTDNEASKLDDSQRGWWYKSREYADRNKTHLLEDVNKTLTHINDVFGSLGPIDGVWGFSMGGELATLLSKISISNMNNQESSLYKNIKFNFVIITASSKSSESLLDFYYDLEKKIDMDSLHIIGKTDKLVPFENAIELTNYFVNAQTYLHELGHFIPNNSESKSVYTEFLSKMLNKYK